MVVVVIMVMVVVMTLDVVVVSFGSIAGGGSPISMHSAGNPGSSTRPCSASGSVPPSDTPSRNRLTISSVSFCTSAVDADTTAQLCALGFQDGVDLRGVARVGAQPAPKDQQQERQVDHLGHAPQRRARDLLIMQRGR